MATQIEASQSLIQSETRYQEVHVAETRTKKKTKSRRHKDEGSISVSKSSEKLYKKMKASSSEQPQCARCARPAFAMERVKAERLVFHRDCFRCNTCNKQLTVETYESDHTTLYCKPHFRQLFEPRPVDGDETDAAPKKHQMIICESQPVELPPDVVRASDKPDLGLEELASLDVKSRFQVFERKQQEEDSSPRETRPPREKSATVLSKLAKFKAKGMDIGMSDECLNGVPLEPSSSDPDDDDDDSVLKKSYSHNPVREPSSLDMSELVGRFERPRPTRHQQRKQEIQNIRSRLFLGKQAKIKEMYEQSVLQCEQSVTSAEKIAKEFEVDSDKARAIKLRFENGEIFNDENTPPKTREVDDPAIFQEGIAKKSRSIFLELDANAKHVPLASPAPEPPKRKEIPVARADVRAGSPPAEVLPPTRAISQRFQFFETYRPPTARREFRMTPPPQQRPESPSPERYHDPSVVGSDPPAPDTSLAAQRHTASRMIGVFRQMEEARHMPQHHGPKPLKRFTPPPPGEAERHGDSSSDCSDLDSDTGRRARAHDDALQQAQQLARTTSFRDRFEHWAECERDGEQRAPSPADRPGRGEGGDSQLETARSLREKFEMMKMQTSTVTKTVTPKVNRFV